MWGLGFRGVGYKGFRASGSGLKVDLNLLLLSLGAFTWRSSIRVPRITSHHKFVPYNPKPYILQFLAPPLPMGLETDGIGIHPSYIGIVRVN